MNENPFVTFYERNQITFCDIVEEWAKTHYDPIKPRKQKIKFNFKKKLDRT